MTLPIEAIEKLIHKEFVEVPFHNLFMLHGINHPPSNYGGTCSDKTLNFYCKLQQMGVKAQLCSGWINGHETHRLLRITIDRQSFFLDIGNGWPCIGRTGVPGEN